MARREVKIPTISKRAKGFPIKLGNEHLYNMHLIYPWLREKGLTDEDTDLALSLFPPFEIPEGEMHMAHKTGFLYSMDYRDADRKVRPFHKTKTHRIRAEHLAPVAKLLRLCGAFISSGQMGNTLVKRAVALEGVSVLDQLCDAQRGGDREATLTLRD